MTRPDAGAAAAPGTRATGNRGLAGWARIAGRLGGALVGLVLAVPLHLLWHALAGHSPFPRLYLRFFARLAGARVVPVGTPLRRDVFLLSNHLSWLDIPVLAGATGTAFVAKAEVADTPLIGWLCRLNRTVFVQREARLDIAAQINALAGAMAESHAITIFPEGTTGDGRALLPFKTAMLKVLEPPPAGVMVQPVVLDYGPLAPFISWAGAESGLANALRILARPGSFPVRAHFLEPFAPEAAGGRKAIAAEARARIAAALGEGPGEPVCPANPAACPAVPGGEAHDRAGA